MSALRLIVQCLELVALLMLLLILRLILLVTHLVDAVHEDS